MLTKFRSCTHRQRRVFVYLVFGSDAEAGVVAAGGPGQSDRCLQLVIHLLEDGATKLCSIVTESTADIQSMMR